MGKSVPLGPEPDREWLTDPPQGYRAPIGPVGQASKLRADRSQDPTGGN